MFIDYDLQYTTQNMCQFNGYHVCLSANRPRFEPCLYHFLKINFEIVQQFAYMTTTDDMAANDNENVMTWQKMNYMAMTGQ